MPEGDTIRILARRVNEQLGGALVERTVTRDPRLVGLDLDGRVLVDADAYGKHLFVRFDDGRSLHAHLMMTGGFALGRRSRETEWKRRIELRLDRGWLTGESVPVLGVIPTPDEHEITDRLGPDLCAEAGPPDVDVVTERLAGAQDQPLTGALLDQRLVAGWGNVYGNDLPFVAGVSPFAPVGEIEHLRSLVAFGVAVIRVNADLGRQNTTGRRLHTDDRWIHARGRSRCLVCGHRLEYRNEQQTPWGRTVTWCPACQPESGERSRSVDEGRLRRLTALHPAARAIVRP